MAPRCPRLYFTSLSWNGLRSTLCSRLIYTALYLSWRNWTGQHCTALLQLAYIDLGCSGWKYTAMYLHGWDLTWVDGTGLEWGVWYSTSSRSDREWVTRSLKKKKKKSNKTGCNQNMPALSLFRVSVELTDITFFSSCSIQRIRVFLFANQPNFTQVSIITLQCFFTYLLTDVHLLKTALSWAAKIFKCFKLPNPFLILFVLLETTLTTIL